MSDTETDELGADGEMDMAAILEEGDSGASASEDDLGDADWGDAGFDDDPDSRILNQDEIDSLLGFDDDIGGPDEASGVMALINSAMVNYERLPMLDIV